MKEDTTAAPPAPTEEKGEEGTEEADGARLPRAAVLSSALVWRELPLHSVPPREAPARASAARTPAPSPARAIEMNATLTARRVRAHTAATPPRSASGTSGARPSGASDAGDESAAAAAATAAAAAATKHSRASEGVSADSVLARALVVVRVATPFVMEGSRYDHVRGVGVVVDKQLGLVIVSRGIVPMLMVETRVVFDGTYDVDATVLFIHPFHNIAVIRYDPRDLVRKLLAGDGEDGGAGGGAARRAVRSEAAWAAAAEEAWRMVEAVAVSAKPMEKVRCGARTISSLLQCCAECL